MERPSHLPLRSPSEKLRVTEIYCLTIDDVLTMIHHELRARYAVPVEGEESEKVDASST